ncbi:MAG: FaeA/PapI family transcriptional regulator [Anaerolineales bacterium]|jgi:predicted ArsR family transcriptional regulator
MEANRERNSRETILTTLRRRGQCSIADLAQQAEISAVSVRHHLGTLQAEGLVEAHEARHGVGRPRLIYQLTEAGLEHFPTRYLTLTNRLLKEMKEHLPESVVQTLFAEIAASMAREVGDELAGLPIEERLPRLLQILAQEGFEAKAEATGNGNFRVTELNCPYYRISVRHPEVCTLDASIISQALASPVRRQSCILSGDQACSFVILSAAKPQPAPATPLVAGLNSEGNL